MQRSVFIVSMFKQLLLFILCVFACSSATFAATLDDFNFEQVDGKLRLFFDLSEDVEHKLFRLDNPERVVIDLPATSLSKDVALEIEAVKPLLGLRYAVRNVDDLRVVLDLQDKMEINSVIMPDGETPRLLVELFNDDTLKAIEVVTPKDEAEPREIIIMVDAGHGGKDPGAIGKRGTLEKDIALSLARKLAGRINKQIGYKAYLTRDKDIFIPLKQRTVLAREKQADLFVSIHADAAKNRSAKGSSVFTLSASGATSEAARWLAERENSSDLVGGVSIDDKDEVLASVLLDLSQRHTNETSVQIAGFLLGELTKLGDTHSDRVEQAGFMVLKSPDIPSVLVESAFLSNSAEEKKLRSKAHQDKLVTSLMRGIKNYFKENAPIGTIVASLRAEEHVIKSGETLSGIAHRYDISLKALRKINKLSSDKIRIGQVLRIPQT